MKKVIFGLFVSIFFLGVIFLTVLSLNKIVTTLAPDFSGLWLCAKDLPTGKNPYLNPNLFTPNGYPPISFLLYLPLTALAYGKAQLIFTLLSFASFIANVYLSLLLSFKKVNWAAFLFSTGLVLLSFPTKFTLGMGEINSVSFLFLLLSYFFYLRKKPWLSGILIGIGMILKPIFGFFLLFFLFVKEWRIILSALGTLISAFVITVLISNFGFWGYWIKEIAIPFLNLNAREVYYNQGLMGFISRLTAEISIRKYLSLILSFLLILISSLYVRHAGRKTLLSYFIIVLLLVDTLSWQHHFVWLIFPFSLLVAHTIKFKKIFLLVLIAAAYLLVSWNFKNPSLFYRFPASLLLSNTFYGTLILLGINLYFLSSRKLTS